MEGTNLGRQPCTHYPEIIEWREKVRDWLGIGDGLPTAQVAAEFGLQPEAFRSYLKEHEPELYARKGMVRTDTGGAVSRRSMEKYSEAMHLYGTTTESVKSLARRFGFNDCSFGQFIRRNFPELVEKHNEIVQKKGKQNK